MYKKIVLVFLLSAIVSTSFLSGCTYLCEKHSDGFYRQKIAEYFDDWPSDYIFLEDWDNGHRNFKIYSWDPDDPENKYIMGGWAYGVIDRCGDISKVNYS